MPSVQRFFSGRNNLVRSAILAASGVRESTAIERISATRSGGGRVRLSGAYTGHEAAQIELEIVAAGGIPRASVPQFIGVGNGQLTIQSVDAAATLQSLTLTLADLGIPTATAGLDVRSARIRARAPGVIGNSIRLAVTPQLTRTATDWALLADWSTGTTRQTGSQWDFGGLPLSTKSELDANSPRIQFGFDPQVYRPWREYKDGDWQFGLSPSLERDIAKGTQVHLITGGYLVSVTDGVTVEAYGDIGAGQPLIRSFNDLLVALQSSALVEVAGVVASDRTVGGQASIDVPLRTQAWLAALSGKVALQDVGVPLQASTQTLTVRCINADTVGYERWSVVGDVSGTLPVATTGVAYDSAAAQFLIPLIAPTTVDSGRWSFKYEPTSRAENAGLPSVCVRPFRFGRNAKARTVTFKYQQRPPADCKCSDMPTPRLSLSCLGLTEGGDMALDAAYQQRLESLYSWRSEFMTANVKLAFAKQWAPVDMDLAEAVTTTFADALAEVWEAPAALAEWDAALTALQLQMAWMMGLDASPWIVRQSFQGGEVGNAWLNPVDNNVYVVVATRHEGSVQIFRDGDIGWTDPASTIWDTSGDVFTVTSTVDGFTHETDYRCLADGAPKDLVVSASTTAATIQDMIRQLARGFGARMDYVRTLAGIVPKSESSSDDAGGCWIDHRDSYWWADVDGYYLPAFTNQAYVSARRDTETGKAYSTMEFGFGLVVACPERLKEGDQLTLRIEQVDSDRPYQVGDEAVIQTIAAGPAWLTGGVDGTDEQTWRVAGGTSGALADYVVPTDGSATPIYSAAGADMLLSLGGIPFSLGDVFTLAIEAGQYRWKRSDGNWSALTDIPEGGAAALVDGITANFDAGAAPSFVPGDSYLFDVHQPWAASHVRDSNASAWGWSDDGASIVIDFGAVQDIEALALARYELPQGAVVTVETSADNASWGPALAMDVARAVSVQFAELQARYLRLTVSNAASGNIGWIWAGQPLATDHHASKCQRRRRWAVGRGSGLNPASLYSGVGDGWSLSWSSGDSAASRLLESDVEQLIGLLDWAQSADEPLLFVPHWLHPVDASLVRFAADALDVSDEHEFQPDAAEHRLLSASLELEPVYA
ncbi:hypothetical protein G7047_19110 [Diaphorobacter sp. HDW4A]|uniref:hypothetical protein n=1 Tax=Diaphorobacter sp. HDW4A TaxID=2714924 RepID=UPI001409840A|nr:hypothetical protein [Diaphorobacter sp. HDW4A]QIL81790.1 hypothetical protein G7047_19110 [Diaphorobacter sp. HDW4A]